MYQYVTDKEYLKLTYSISADLVNRLVQELKPRGVETVMDAVGGQKWELTVQNGSEPVDYEFNMFILNADAFRADELKEAVRCAFNAVLNKNGWNDCTDSTTAFVTEARILRKGNKTPFRIQTAIVKVDSNGAVYRLIHKKTGKAAMDQWHWNMVRNSRTLWAEEDFLMPKYRAAVKERYLAKKNEYLSKRDGSRSSFLCYIEAVNETYEQVQRQNG